MSDEQDTTPKKRGRPKGSKKGEPLPTLLNAKRRQYSYSLMERIRERINPDLLIDFHMMVLEGKTPVFTRIGADEWEVTPDPNPLAQTPTLADRDRSAKWLSERGHGLPVQSIQVDAEYRHKLELLGSGVPTEVLSGLNPQVLAHLQQAMQLVSGNTSNEDVIEAEFTELPPDSGDLTQNSPLESTPSELISENNDK